MDLDGALDEFRSAGGKTVRHGEPLWDAMEVVLRYCADLERRSRQVEGGHYLRYARADEVARWIRTGNREEAE